MKIFLILLLCLCFYIVGIVREHKAKRMKPSRKIDLTFKSLFSIITFKKLYICDNCNKIHKHLKDDLDICGGWYKHKVFVSQSCGKKVISNCHRLIRKSAIYHSTYTLSELLKDQPNNIDIINEASERLIELYQNNIELCKKVYNT